MPHAHYKSAFKFLVQARVRDILENAVSGERMSSPKEMWQARVSGWNFHYKLIAKLVDREAESQVIKITRLSAQRIRRADEIAAHHLDDVKMLEEFARFSHREHTAALASNKLQMPLPLGDLDARDSIAFDDDVAAAFGQLEGAIKQNIAIEDVNPYPSRASTKSL